MYSLLNLLLLTLTHHPPQMGPSPSSGDDRKNSAATWLLHYPSTGQLERESTAWRFGWHYSSGIHCLRTGIPQSLHHVEQARCPQTGTPQLFCQAEGDASDMNAWSLATLIFQSPGFECTNCRSELGHNLYSYPWGILLTQTTKWFRHCKNSPMKLLPPTYRKRDNNSNPSYLSFLEHKHEKAAKTRRGKEVPEQQELHMQGVTSCRRKALGFRLKLPVLKWQGLL